MEMSDYSGFDKIALCYNKKWLVKETIKLRSIHMFMNNIDVRLVENSRNLVHFCWKLFFDALASIGFTIFVCLYSIVGRSVRMILIIFKTHRPISLKFWHVKMAFYRKIS